MADSGKAARVGGFFVFLLGAGIVLDSRADVWGGLLAAAGAAVLLWGLLQTGARTRPLGEDSQRGAARC
jgi:hypothetical protein